MKKYTLLFFTFLFLNTATLSYAQTQQEYDCWNYAYDASEYFGEKYGLSDLEVYYEFVFAFGTCMDGEPSDII